MVSCSQNSMAPTTRQSVFIRSLVVALIAVASLTLISLQWDQDAVAGRGRNTRLVAKDDFHRLDQDYRDDELHALNRTLLTRGLNVITAASGCHLAGWLYESGPRKFRDCWPLHSHRHLAAQVDMFSGTPPDMEANDTVYVNFKGLWDFSQNVLPKLNVSITLITGQFHKTRTDMMSTHFVQTLLDHPLIAKWFCQSIDNYVPFVLTNHSKFAPWPFGVQHVPYTPYQPNPLPIFKQAFFQHLHTPKTKGIMIGYVSNETNPERAKITPSGPKLNLSDYYDDLAQHQFIISPNGDRPECYRHYEAIALGAIPLTQLDPALYSHLQDGPVVYNMTNFWNLTLESPPLADLVHGQTISHFPIATNRRMVTEEYWLEYADRIMGMPLRWCDILQNHQRMLLKDFLFESSPS
jgi:hypothetical protein